MRQYLLPEGITARDVSDEVEREVLQPDGKGGYTIYAIDKPQVVFIRNNGTTLRILDDAGIMHLVPAPGVNGTIHRWIPRDVNNPLQF